MKVGIAVSQLKSDILNSIKSATGLGSNKILFVTTELKLAWISLSPVVRTLLTKASLTQIRDYLELGTSATKNIGTTVNDIASGDTLDLSKSYTDTAVSKIDYSGVLNSSKNYSDTLISGLSSVYVGKDAVGTTVCPLQDGYIPSQLIPGSVDEILEFDTFALFPVDGNTNKMYLDKQENNIYRWSGTVYIQINRTPGSIDDLTDGINNKFYKNTYVQTIINTRLGVLAEQNPDDILIQKHGTLLDTISTGFGIGTDYKIFYGFNDKDSKMSGGWYDIAGYIPTLLASKTEDDYLANLKVSNVFRDILISENKTYIRQQLGIVGLGGDMIGSNNLSELTNTTLARSHLGLGDAVTYNFGTTTFSIARGDAAGIALTDAKSYTDSRITNSLAGYIPSSEIGVSVCELTSGRIPSSRLPAYVDVIVEYTNVASFPATGATNIIYLALDTGKFYRWSGSIYGEISASPGTTDDIVEGSKNLYYKESYVTSALNTALTSLRSISGLVKGAGDGSFSKASVGIDYENPLTFSGALSRTVDTIIVTAGGITNAMLEGGIDLTTKVTGYLTVPNGGTGVSTLTGYVKGNGTSPMSASATVPVTDITGTLPSSKGGTGISSFGSGGYLKFDSSGVMSLLTSIPGSDVANTNEVTTSVTNKSSVNVAASADNLISITIPTPGLYRFHFACNWNTSYSAVGLGLKLTGLVNGYGIGNVIIQNTSTVYTTGVLLTTSENGVVSASVGSGNVGFHLARIEGSLYAYSNNSVLTIKFYTSTNGYPVDVQLAKLTVW